MTSNSEFTDNYFGKSGYDIKGKNRIISKSNINSNNHQPLTSSNNNDLHPISHQGFKCTTSDGSKLCFMGIKVESILHWELFQQRSFPTSFDTKIPLLCQKQWIDFAKALAVSRESLEFLMIIGSHSTLIDSSAKVSITFWIIGRGKTFTQAQTACKHSFQQFWWLLNSNLDFIQFQPLDSNLAISMLKTYLTTNHVLELRRRYEDIQVGHCASRVTKKAFLGFQIEEEQPLEDNSNSKFQVRHLFPWTPSNDSGEKLLEMFKERPNSGALIIHFQTLAEVQQQVQEEAYLNLANTEKLLNTPEEHLWEQDTTLTSQASVIRDLSLQRLNFLKGSVLAARVFIATPQPPSSETIATISCSIDSSFPFAYQEKAQMLFCGGVKTLLSTSKKILDPLLSPSLDLLFAPEEAPSILRTPMPCGSELPGITSIRCRTAPMTGTSGTDLQLGINKHRASSQPVWLDDKLRFRHTYVVGQTGTGKSTLLTQMILQDIKKGRGVAVLDPHGTMIEDILENYPQERAEDLIIVDLTDTERPIGFNILCINESDPFQYQLKRDLLIDEIYAYLDRTYDMKQTGGPIFESHFRSSMALLLGSKSQEYPRIPNLMIFRALYTNPNLRKFLTKTEEDPVLIDFVKEAEQTGGEASVENLAPYITSKFTRFISDTALRNITCQSRILDVDAIVNQGKVLLFNLGKARFGAQAAGLLSSQIVSRICNAAMKRGPGGNPFYLYADEFQLFADERFAEILAEGRKFNLSVTMAHQYINQLPGTVLSAILGNVGTIITLRVGAVDAQNLEPLFVPTFGNRDLSSLPNYLAYVKSSGLLGQTPFSMELLPLPQEKNTTLAAQLRQMSRMKYGRDRHIVQQEIMKTYKHYNKLF